ncbi:hypothetical protein [Variovorax sp. NFACC29]|uniref:hypothetical protein n=1 Tax=Variovorax sp. NFACC29 TaxID=1566272 RepID=UPI003AAF170C
MLPGVAYLELARAAVVQALELAAPQARDVRLEQVVFTQPVVVGDAPVECAHCACAAGRWVGELRGVHPGRGRGGGAGACTGACAGCGGGGCAARGPGAAAVAVFAGVVGRGLLRGLCADGAGIRPGVPGACASLGGSGRGGSTDGAG